MKKLLSALAAVAAVATLSACTPTDTATGTNSAYQGNAGGPATTVQPAPVTSAPATSYTVAQQNAIEAARSYLETSSFSRAGLIEQLSSSAGDGFALADATFAVDHVTVDWNAEAVQAAKSYLQMGGFSRASLIDQLSSKAGDQYTVAQATYAANHVGL